MKARRASRRCKGFPLITDTCTALSGCATFHRAGHEVSRQQDATSNQEFAMKKALYSLAVLMRFARADKLSAPYIYY
ncbi:cittilin family RiPP precursor [Myxococcus sp. SDU36]|nr:cittilin family RiPP precursor [Myxococcus sp. SDU36]